MGGMLRGRCRYCKRAIWDTHQAHFAVCGVLRKLAVPDPPRPHPLTTCVKAKTRRKRRAGVRPIELVS